MMKKLLFSLLISTSLFAFTVPPHPTINEFEKELGIEVVQGEETASKLTTHLILVHHGQTDWSETKRLQGWNNLPLNELGKKETKELADEMSGLKVAAIYTSSSQSSIETGKILQETLTAPVVPMDELRGEFHGGIEGMTKEQYEQDPHFKFYYSLPTEEEIFFSCGPNGESKADVAKRIVPALKKIAEQHKGQAVVIVSHGGLFKFLNYVRGKYTQDGTISIPYSSAMIIEADGEHLYVQKDKTQQSPQQDSATNQ